MRYLKGLAALAALTSVLAAGCASSGAKSQASSKPPAGSTPPQAPPPPAVSTSSLSSYADLNALFNKGAAPSADSLGGAFALKVYGTDGAREQVFYVAGANFQAASGPAAFKVVPLGFFPPDQTPDSDMVFGAAQTKAPSVSEAVPTSRGLEFDVTECAPGAKLPLCRDEWRAASGLTILHISCWHDASASGVPAVDLLGYVADRVYGVSSKPLSEGPAPSCAAITPPASSAGVAGTWRGLYTQKVGADSCGKARATVCDPWGMTLEQSGSNVTVAEGCCGASCGKAGWSGEIKGRDLLINASNASCGGANPVMKVRCSLRGTDILSCRTSGSTCGRCGNDAVSVSGNALLSRSTEPLPAPSRPSLAGVWSGTMTAVPSAGVCPSGYETDVMSPFMLAISTGPAGLAVTRAYPVSQIPTATLSGNTLTLHFQSAPGNCGCNNTSSVTVACLLGGAAMTCSGSGVFCGPCDMSERNGTSGPYPNPPAPAGCGGMGQGSVSGSLALTANPVWPPVQNNNNNGNASCVPRTATPQTPFNGYWSGALNFSQISSASSCPVNSQTTCPLSFCLSQTGNSVTGTASCGFDFGNWSFSGTATGQAISVTVQSGEGCESAGLAPRSSFNCSLSGTGNPPNLVCTPSGTMCGGGGGMTCPNGSPMPQTLFAIGGSATLTPSSGPSPSSLPSSLMGTWSGSFTENVSGDCGGQSENSATPCSPATITISTGGVSFSCLGTGTNFNGNGFGGGFSSANFDGQNLTLTNGPMACGSAGTASGYSIVCSVNGGSMNCSMSGDNCFNQCYPASGPVYGVLSVSGGGTLTLQ